MGSARDKHGVRQRFAKDLLFNREEWPFADKGIQINPHTYIYIYTRRIAFLTFNGEPTNFGCTVSMFKQEISG